MSDAQIIAAKLSDLIPDEENANEGTERGLAMLDKSLRDYRAGRGILLDKKGRVIAGNKTRERAMDVGIEEVLIVQTDGSKLVATQRMDLDLETDPEARALAYADNRVGELDLSWKVEQIVKDAAKGVDLSGFFYSDEIDRMVSGVVEEEQQAKADGDDTAPEMELQPFEHYDYIVLLFRNTFDWTAAAELFGLERKAVDIGNERRKIGMCRVLDGGRALAVLVQSRGEAR